MNTERSTSGRRAILIVSGCDLNHLSIRARLGRWRCPPRVALIAAILLTLQAGRPSLVCAKLCGDHIRGKDVPCDCGDTVASDLKLTDDPIVSATCQSDGLIVRAPNAANPLRIDLAGHGLHGTGNGVGIWVLHGGPGGASIVSTGEMATIEGFRDGVVARGSDSVALIDGVVARANARDGLRLAGVAATKVRNCEAVDSGRDGFSIDGKKFQLTNTRSLGSRRFGYRISGERGVIGRAAAGNAATRSGHTGFLITGAHHSITGCIAARSGRDGLRVRGTYHEMNACIARHNAGNGITGSGRHWRLARNSATDNGGDGIAVTGKAMVDAGGNSGGGNRGGGRSRRVIQCELGKLTCRK